MSDDLWYASLSELGALLERRQLSAEELLDAHLDRVAAVNPDVNAVVSLDPELARTEARRSDERRAQGRTLGPLDGLPAAFKDTHATAGLRTTYGSPLFAEHVPSEDDLVVARLRRAGVVTLGKTNVPEFAAGSHTFNPVFGLTRNPYDLSRSAGGSSGGAAAALASGMVAVAEGSDLGGSLRNPASFNNVVGLRPTPGRVPDWPSAAYWDAMSVSGPMGRTVEDVALLLSVIAGPDPRVAYSLEQPGASFAAPLEQDVRGLRVAFSTDLGGLVQVDPEVAGIVRAQAAVFAGLGCRVDEACLDFAGADEAFRTLRAWAFAASSRELLDQPEAMVKPSLRWNIEQGLMLSGADVARADGLRATVFQRAHEFFQRYDVLVLPTSQVPPFDGDLEYPTSIGGVEQTTYLDWMASSYLVTVSGSPSLSVPAGFTAEGLPVGVQLVGPHRGEQLVLRVGQAFEQATRVGQRRPTFRGTRAAGPQ